MTAAIAHEGATGRANSATVPLIRLSLLAVALIALTAAAAVAIRAVNDYAFMVPAIASGLVAIAATREAERAPTKQALWMVIGVAAILRIGLIALDPLLSTDIYRYIWDGKVQAAGINPYRYLPADAALAALRDSLVYPNINRPNYAVTIYPPVAQMFFFLVTRVGESVTTMKIAMVACDAAIAGIIVLFLERLKQPVTRLTAYLWHPLPLWQIANNGHVDALMTMLMMLGLWFALTERPMRGAVAVTLGALAKPFALVALPMVWRPWDWKVPVLVAAVVALCYLPYLSVGWGVFGYLATGYLHEEGFESGQAFWPLAVLRVLIGSTHGDLALYLALSMLALAGLGLFAAHRWRQSLEVRLGDFNISMLVFFFLLSPHYPWYVLMLVPFVAIRGGAANWVLSIGAFLLQDEVWWDYYVPLLMRETILYGAFIAACVYMAWQVWGRRSARGQVRHELAGA